MQYYKIKISLKNYENRLNRTILFKTTNVIDSLAHTILSIFNTSSSHLYMFEDDVNKYECSLSLKEAETFNLSDMGLDTCVMIENLIMKDNKFIMLYDYGARYEFVIEILDTLFLNRQSKIPEVIDGVGYGIVEDDKEGLEDYLDGKFIDHPLLFIKNRRFMEVDFNSFDLVKCNRKLKREYALIQAMYFAITKKSLESLK